jgi:hypothetical protein
MTAALIISGVLVVACATATGPFADQQPPADEHRVR